MKSAFRAAADNIPEPFPRFLFALDAMKVLPRAQSRLAREMKEVAVEAAAARRNRRRNT
jgi:hypothetical protein